MKKLIVALSLGAAINGNAQEIGKTYYIQCIANNKNLYATGANNGDQVQLMTPDPSSANQKWKFIKAVKGNAYIIVCVGNTRALDATAADGPNKNKDGVKVQMFEAHGDLPCQYWLINKKGNNYQLVADASGKSLYCPNAGTKTDADATALRTRTPNPTQTVEQWKFIEVN